MLCPAFDGLRMSNQRILIATGNPGKAREIAAIYRDVPAPWCYYADLSETYGTPPDPVEDGVTFRDNALIKARAASKWAGIPAMAEDSGLVVDALDGAPGVWSARFAGEDASDAENVELLLSSMEETPDGRRTARFRAVLVVVSPNGTVIEAEGVVEGRIALSPRGSSGFGYDPVFIPAGHEATFAELGLEVKNRMSHRARALENLRPALVDALRRGALSAE